MNGEFRLGDKVRTEVAEVLNADDASVLLRFTDGMESWHGTRHLELVERPQPRPKVGDVLNGKEIAEAALPVGTVISDRFRTRFALSRRGWLHLCSRVECDLPVEMPWPYRIEFIPGESA